MTQESHELDETDCANDASNYTNEALRDNELPRPVIVREREEWEAKIAEDKSFQCEPNNLESSTW